MNTVRKMVETRTCVGCGECEGKCPSGCIRMKLCELGFSMPVIDEEKCTGCGECIKHCPFSDEDGDDE